MRGAKQGADALAGGVLKGVGGAYDNVRDAVADGIVGKRVRVAIQSFFGPSFVPKNGQSN